MCSDKKSNVNDIANDLLKSCKDDSLMDKGKPFPKKLRS